MIDQKENLFSKLNSERFNFIENKYSGYQYKNINNNNNFVFIDRI